MKTLTTKSNISEVYKNPVGHDLLTLLVKSLGVKEKLLTNPLVSRIKISTLLRAKPEFGTMEDFDELLEKAHKKGIRIIMDLVVNHPSDEHVGFQDALSNPNSPYRDFYFFRQEEDKLPNNWTYSDFDFLYSSEDRKDATWCPYEVRIWHKAAKEGR